MSRIFRFSPKFYNGVIKEGYKYSSDEATSNNVYLELMTLV